MGPLIKRRSTAGRAVATLSVACMLATLPSGFDGKGHVHAQAQTAIAVIIASSSPISNIDSGVLRTAFLNLRATQQGQRLLPFNLPIESPTRKRFDHAVLDLRPDQVGNFWVDQRVRDGRRPPRTVPDTGLAVRVVANLKGAISYVPLAAAQTPAVRVLRVDGKAPSDPGYLLP